MVAPDNSNVSIAVTCSLVKSGQFLSFSKMKGSEFWMYEPLRVQHMFPRSATCSRLNPLPVMPWKEKKMDHTVNVKAISFFTIYHMCNDGIIQ